MKPCTFAWKLWLAGFLLGGVGSSLGGNTYYVDPVNGTDTGSSTTGWGQAFKTVSYAVSKSTGGNGDTILVSQGTNTLTASNMAVQDQTIQGGYQTGGATRDPVAFPTILDGANAYRAFSKTVATKFTLDGLTVRNCTNSAAGGALTASAGNLNIFNCLFTNNISASTGGAIYHNAAATNNVFSNCTFTANSSSANNGGAIYFATISTNVFQFCTFVTNSAPASGKAGGAIYDNVAGLDRWTGCTFSNNTCNTGGGGAIYSKGRLDLSGGSDIFYGNYCSGGGGGAIFHNLTGASNIFSNCTFVTNVGASGGANGYGGAICFGALSTNVFQACAFVSNSVSGSSGYSYGGGIAENTGGGLLRLTGCTFSNNSTVYKGGGAVYSQGTLDLSGGSNVFYGNSAASGGAISQVRAGSSNVFNNCSFVANVAAIGQDGYGGAVYFGALSTNVLQGCTFVTNLVLNNVDQYTSGGAIAEGAAGGLLRLTSCVFSNNATVRNSGGAVYSQGTLDMSGGSNLFYGNSAPAGGAIYNGYGATNHLLRNCTFTANTGGSGQSGGGIFFGVACTATVANCAFIKNSSSGNGSGGAIFIYDYLSHPGQCLLVNCTFFANQATGTGQGGAMMSQNPCTLNVTNCIFWGNTSGGTGTNIQNAGTVTIAYSDIATNANAVNGGTKVFGVGIINADPLFAGTAAPYDVHEKSQGGRYSNSVWVVDSQTSPCIDAGVPFSVDPVLGGCGNEPMPNGGRVNLGAYGNTFQASKSYAAYMVMLGTNGATIAVAEAATSAKGSDYGTVNLGAPVDHTFTITNNGAAALSLTGTPIIAISGNTTDFYTNGMVTATSIPAGGSTTFTVEFNPQSASPRSATVSIANNDPSQNPYTFALAGTGYSAGTPDIGVLGTNGVIIAIGEAATTAKGTDFGSVVTNLFLDNVFTVTNMGGAVLTLTGATTVAISGNTGDFFTNGTAVTTSIASGGSSTLQIRFAPTAMGVRTALVTLANNATTASKDPYTFTLRGMGLNGALMAVQGTNGAVIAMGAAATAASGTDFGALVTNAGVYSEHVFTVTNAGIGTLTLTGATAVTISGNTGDFFTNGTALATSIAPGGSSTFQIHFAPTTTGIRTALVTIADNALGMNPYTFALQGRGDDGIVMGVLGTNGANIAVGEGATVAKGTDWGFLTLGGGTVDHTFTITNQGVNALALSGSPRVALSGDTNYTLTADAATPVAAGGATTFTLRFNPGAGGVHLALVTIANSDVDQNPYTFALQASVSVAGVPGVVYVSPIATMTPENGTDWLHAYRTLTNALSSSPNGSVFWVSGVLTSPVAAGMDIKTNTLYGGFQGGETALSQRNWAQYPTVLDGGGSNRVLQKSAGASAATLDGFTVRNGLNASGGGGLYCSSGNLNIFNCLFTNNLAPSGGGGAIYHAYAGANNNFSNCTFVANVGASGGAGGYGGAVIFASLSTNVFLGCTFVSNTVSGHSTYSYGGAIAESAAGCVLRLTDCTFSNNSTVYNGGGAVYSQGTLDLSGGNNLFYGNSSSNGNGGGAIFQWSAGANNVFSNCTFVANVGAYGSGIGYGGGVCFGQPSTNVFAGCTFLSNSVSGSATYTAGGALAMDGNYAAGGVLRLTGCTFSNNSTLYNGGGAVATLGTLDLSGGNNGFYGNSCGGSGGAIYNNCADTNHVFRNCTFSANSSGNGQYGGAIFFNAACTATVANCAFVANSFSGGNGSGGSIYFTGAGLYALVNCTFFANQATGTGQGGAVRNANAGATLNVGNCIFWGNASGGTGTNIQNAGTVTIAYSDLATNASAVNGGTKIFGAGIINADPLFVSTTAPYDVHEKSLYGHWTAAGWVNDLVSSPCIDAGDPASDYSLEPPSNGGRINMGAYADTPQASKSRPNGTLMFVR